MIYLRERGLRHCEITWRDGCHSKASGRLLKLSSAHVSPNRPVALSLVETERFSPIAACKMATA